MVQIVMMAVLIATLATGGGIRRERWCITYKARPVVCWVQWVPASW